VGPSGVIFWLLAAVCRIGAAVALDVLCCYFPGRKELIEADEVKVTRNRTRARNISQDLASSARAQVR